MTRFRRFTIYAWLVLGYTVLVILWGAYVRATGSGAGCGSHWPLCNGQVIPRAPAVETLVEYSHRLTSAFSGFLVLGLLFGAFRLYPKGHPVRRGAVLSTFFIVTEGLVGAGLVLFELVAYNESAARAMWGAAHLVNTFLLLAALTLTVWWAMGERPLRWRQQGHITWWVASSLVAVLILGASGAITALGDTLYPATSLAEGIQQDFSPTAHFLIRLRVWHPTLAILIGLYLVISSTLIYRARPNQQTLVFSRMLKVLYIAQLLAGALNVFLLAPVWMQLVHLLLADVVWITLVMLAAAALAESVPIAGQVPVVQPGD
ncbi:MAG: heme A synthase [Chloroflexi bacterium]|nr:MAG: heme A synthase [Chloroflexota bacterium]